MPVWFDVLNFGHPCFVPGGGEPLMMGCQYVFMASVLLLLVGSCATLLALCVWPGGVGDWGFGEWCWRSFVSALLWVVGVVVGLGVLFAVFWLLVLPHGR